MKTPFHLGTSLLIPMLLLGQIHSQSAYAMAIHNRTNCTIKYILERTASADHNSHGTINAKQTKQGPDLWSPADEPTRPESIYVTIQPRCKDQPNIDTRIMPAMSAPDCEITCSTQHEVLQLTRNKACKPQTKKLPAGSP